MQSVFEATTIIAVRHSGQGAISGDGQVTFANQMIMKNTAKKVRKLYKDQVIAGFAGSVADAITLFEKFEHKLDEHNGVVPRAAVELARIWRLDRALQRLEAMMVVMNQDSLLLISGNGEIIEPDDGIIAIGSGGSFALAAGRALIRHASHLSASDISRHALEIAADICVFTNHQIITEEI